MKPLRIATLTLLTLAVVVTPTFAQTTPSKLPPLPVRRALLTEDYVRQLGRFTYFWAWPMISLHNRRMAVERVPFPGLVGGVPVAPVNQLCMLTDYVTPQARVIACPNQDVVYGGGILNLQQEPVVIQVPQFDQRFWVYQIGDLRTDSFANLGAMYGTQPGFYLLVGPDWKGKPPEGINAVFRSPTRTGFIIARVFQADDPQDRKTIQPLLNQIVAYPLREFDGKIKTRNWAQVTQFPALLGGAAETRWVVPERFFGTLPAALDAIPPLPGEESLYQQVRAVLTAARENSRLGAVLKQAATEAEKELIAPLFHFRNYGVQLPHHWTTVTNGAAFGTDYFTRTAVAKSNMFVNRPNETRYFYQDLDSQGRRLQGNRQYSVTFAKGQLPPVKGCWSLTLYNEHHFFAPNQLNRFSLGTKNRDLQFNPDGSLTLYVQSEAPAARLRANWLPAPNGDFSLYLRAYWPAASICEGKWCPPPVEPARLGREVSQRWNRPAFGLDLLRQAIDRNEPQ